jgi:hypothetical protein
MATMFPLILAFTVVVCLRVPALADSDVANKSETASPSEDIWKRDTLTGNWGCVRKSLEDAGLTLTVNEQSGLWANLTGGQRTGGAYVGLTTSSLKLDLAKLKSWQGATFFANAYQIHGFGPSANFVGNQQFVIRTAPQHVPRSRIIPYSAGRSSVLGVARVSGVSRPAVWRWQPRYAEQSGCKPGAPPNHYISESLKNRGIIVRGE